MCVCVTRLKMENKLSNNCALGELVYVCTFWRFAKCLFATYISRGYFDAREECARVLRLSHEYGAFSELLRNLYVNGRNYLLLIRTYVCTSARLRCE